jgi:uncharacterized Ntn-hydrolase superfamily protein
VPPRVVHTFSIVARDPATGEMGVAVQSHVFGVGTIVPWVRAGVGAVATQAHVDIGYGLKGLELMGNGLSAPDALSRLLAEDKDSEVRQVLAVDAQGRVAAHTGGRCIPCAGHVIGDGFCVGANMMLNDTVWPAMERSFREAHGDLAVRMVRALEAAQEAGGDVRGQQSAALVIVRAESTGRPWEDTVADLRVDDHPAPITELGRLVALRQANQRMDRGDEFWSRGNFEAALTEYEAGSSMPPQIPELRFWYAVALADAGRLDEALPIFREVFDREPNFALLAQRLPISGRLRGGADMMAQVLGEID